MSDSLAASVLRSVKARGDDIGDKDQALVDLAVRYALQIDAGIKAGGQDATKALYLGPHLVKALERLGCTPVVVPEESKKGSGSSGAGAGIDELSALRSRHRGGA